MFETSKDILYYVLAFCILWITVFICWFLFYVVSIIGSVRKVIKGIQEKLEKVDELINLVKDKVEHSATYLPLIVEGIGKLVDYFKDKKNNQPASADQPAKKGLGKKIKVVAEED